MSETNERVLELIGSDTEDSVAEPEFSDASMSEEGQFADIIANGLKLHQTLLEEHPAYQRFLTHEMLKTYKPSLNPRLYKSNAGQRGHTAEECQVLYQIEHAAGVFFEKGVIDTSVRDRILRLIDNVKGQANAWTLEDILPEIAGILLHEFSVIAQNHRDTMQELQVRLSHWRGPLFFVEQYCQDEGVFAKFKFLGAKVANDCLRLSATMVAVPSKEEVESEEDNRLPLARFPSGLLD